MRVVELAMAGETIFICSGCVASHPFDQIIEHGLLCLRTWEFLWLPRPCQAMAHTGIDTRVKKPKLRAVRQYVFDQVRIASLDDPFPMGVDERLQQGLALSQGFALGSVVPGDFVERQSGDLATGERDQRPCHGGLACTCIPQQYDSHVILGSVVLRLHVATYSVSTTISISPGRPEAMAASTAGRISATVVIRCAGTPIEVASAW